MAKRNMENVIKYLTQFENTPKKIEGNMITEWFNVGENIFTEFYNLGITVKWKSSEVKSNQAEVNRIINMISRNQGWLQSFITIYPGFRIDLEGATSATDVCRVRSGIEFLLQGLVNIDSTFDKVLNNMKVLGELEEFDEHLKIWTEGFRPNFLSGDKHESIPKSHWWWF